MITFKSTGSFKNTDRFLGIAQHLDIVSILSRYGQEGVTALANATPKESGFTADSWYYEVYHKGSTYRIRWCNSHVENGVPIAIILEYGHGTGTGGYVQGRDYINPAIKPIFDRIQNEVWKAVTTA